MSHNCASHSDCIETSLAKAEAYCEAHGLRFTDIRRRVFEIIWQSHKALSANEIMTLLGNKQPPITYRALEFLTGNGLIHHIGSINAYIGCDHPGEDHAGQLLICKDCHQVTEVEQKIPALAKAAREQGFHIDHVQVEVLGQCEHCHAPHEAHHHA